MALQKIKTFFTAYQVQIIISLIAIPYLVGQTLHHGDFQILLVAAGYLCKGASPYGILMHIEGEVWDVFLYSPFVGFVTMPLTYLPRFIPIFAFNVFSFFLLFRIWRIMGNWLQINNLTGAQKRWWFVLTVFLILRFILHNFENSQQNIMVLYLSLEGLYQIFLRGKNAGGMLLALGICIKILPVVFLPYLLYRKKITALLATVVFSILLLLLPVLWFGMPFEKELLTGWWNAINPALDRYNADQNAGIMFHCITALIPVYFSDCAYHGFSVNIMHLDKQQLSWIINGLRALLVLFTLYFLWVGRLAKNNNHLYLFWQLAYIFLLIPLIFPNQNKYAYLNLLPSYGYLVYYFISIYGLPAASAKKDKTILLLAMAPVIIFTVLTADIFWGMAIGKYFQFMKLITIGTLPLIPALAYFSPGRLFKRRPDVYV